MTPTHDHAPATLGHAGIAARVPHAAAMCLLDALLRWDSDEIECRITGHADAAHPLRDRGVEPCNVTAGATAGAHTHHGTAADHGLPATCAIEYAAQAMALHASLHATSKRGAGAAPTPGFLASARDVRLHVPRIDTAPGPLRVLARRQAGDDRQAMYRFVLHDATGALLVEGRATVVLNTPLPRAAGAASTTPTASP